MAAQIGFTQQEVDEYVHAAKLEVLRELDERADELMKTTSFSKAWQQAVQEKMGELESALAEKEPSHGV